MQIMAIFYSIIYIQYGAYTHHIIIGHSCVEYKEEVFAIPTSLGKTAQYAWFFIAYTLLNAVFYTANNIAYGFEYFTWKR